MIPSKSYRVLIVGGGTAGIAVASRLARRLPAGSIALLDPAETHYYQPLFTLVGGGATKLSTSARPMANLIPAGVLWLKDQAVKFRPDANAVDTTSGTVTYDYLVAAPGIHVDWTAVPGLVDALESSQVASNYSERYVESTWEQLKAFRGGPAVFTHPATPIKCGGAPQKIMYLADDHFRRTGIRAASEVIFATAGDKLFAVEKYRKALESVVQDRGIAVRFKHDLVKVDGGRRVATFKNLLTGAEVEQPFAFLHVTPPMRAPDVVRASPLAAGDGWLEVDKETLRHPRFPNVFALGDASNLPTSKTGAAIRKQAPVVVANLLAAMAGKPTLARYDGYTSCPLVTGYGKLILAEFDYALSPRETFPFDQSKERRSMYYLKRDVLPQLYWHGMMKGRA